MKNNQLIMPIYVLCFVLVFSIYPGMVPNRSIIIAILLILTILLQKVRYIKKNSYLFLLILLFFIDLLANIINSTNTIEHIIYFIEYFCVVFSLSYFFDNNEDNLTNICKVLFYTSFIGGPVIGIIQMIMGRYLFSPVSSDINMYFSTVISNVSHTNSNYTAINMLFCFTLAGLLYMRDKKIWYALCFIISFVCITLTFSRTTIFISVLIVALYCLTKKSDFARVTPVRLFVYIVLIFAVFLLFDKMFSLITDFFISSDVQKIMQVKETSTVSLRSGQWRASLELLFNGGINGLIGYGDNAALELGKITGNSMTAHNFLFGRMSESGIVGFILALCIYIETFVRIFKNYKKSNNQTKWIFLCMGGMLLCYLMISNYSWELIIMYVLFDYAARTTEKTARSINIGDNRYE